MFNIRFQIVENKSKLYNKIAELSFICFNILSLVIIGPEHDLKRATQSVYKTPIWFGIVFLVRRGALAAART